MKLIYINGSVLVKYYNEEIYCYTYGSGRGQRLATYISTVNVVWEERRCARKRSRLLQGNMLRF